MGSRAFRQRGGRRHACSNTPTLETHPMHPHSKAAACASILACTCAAGAQDSLTLYGNIDEYMNYMKSSSGNHVLALEDGAYLRSRWGLKGNEDLGGGYAARFQLEGGINADTGGSATSGVLFDRQSWIGIGTHVGEFRIGRQNGPIFARGGYIDYTARTLGSVINDFGVPSRYDNDVSFYSKGTGGVQFEAHVSLPESPVGNHPIVYQVGLDYVGDAVAAGYAGLRGRPPTNPAIDQDVVYDNVYADWMYGKGTVYLAFVHSNNVTANATSNTAGTILGNTGGYNAGTNPDLRHFYDLWQVSADYHLTPLLRVGALWGRIVDTSGRDQGASGGSVGAYYDLSKRTTVYALADTIRNDANGGFRPQGSAGLKSNFTNPADVNGRTISGLQAGCLIRF
jgi:predicted porin